MQPGAPVCVTGFSVLWKFSTVTDTKMPIRLHTPVQAGAIAASGATNSIAPP